MYFKTITTYLVTALAIILSPHSEASKSNNLPESFLGETKNSKFEIGYQDLDALLESSVLRMGRSNRTKAKKSVAQIGTRLKNNVKKLTALEGNRFYFEGYKTEEKKALVNAIKESLERLPSEAALNLFTKEEQLAYWLNLYNVTVINELIKIYPKKNLEKALTGKNGILNKKLLSVGGTQLSLNDIQYKILMQKFGKDPLVMYGLYQGIIGSPNIRKQAYTGGNVYHMLEENATEFVNSNRGTYAGKKKNQMRVSSLYKRNKIYFDNFKTDLKEHLLTYMEGYTRYKLEDAKKLKANISDWNITDLYGSERKFGAGVNTNNAALHDSISNPNRDRVYAGGSGVPHVDLSLGSSFMVGKTVPFGRFTPEQAEKLRELAKMKKIKSGSVTITDIEDGEN